MFITSWVNKIKVFLTNLSAKDECQFALDYLNAHNKLICLTNNKAEIIYSNIYFQKLINKILPNVISPQLGDIFINELDIFNKLFDLQKQAQDKGEATFIFEPQTNLVSLIKDELNFDNSLLVEVKLFNFKNKQNFLWQFSNIEADYKKISPQSLLEKLPLAFAVFSSNGQILDNNEAFKSLFGSIVSQSELRKFLSSEDFEKFNKIFNSLTIGSTDLLDIVINNNIKRYLHCYFVVLPKQDITQWKNNEERVILLSFIEITSQKILEENAMESQKMQAVGQLAGGIAHDFNNVLTSIIMSTDMLLSKHRRSDSSFLDLINIKQNASRAASLVRQLLAFSRRQTLRPEIIDLTNILADWRLMLSRYVNLDINLQIEYGRNLWPVKVDVDEFSRVLVNLVVNSVDAMPNGGTITIRTKNIIATEAEKFSPLGIKVNDYVLLEVEDTGNGMSEKILSKVFDPFFTTKEVGKGTGLGLSMAYGIIKQMGGYLICNSQENVGTIFKIFLPRYIPQLDDFLDNKKTLPEKTISDLSGSATILYAEDEDTVRMGAVRILKSRGYNLLEARSGAEALEILRNNNSVDLIISDVVMPEMDGATLLNEVQKLNINVPFIFVSGYAEDVFAKNLPKDMKFTFLPKPFSLKEIATCVKQILDNK
ncbi:ATP-binding protein [Bartonella sp. DGB1]|uniref:ATP-binding protein n=1 Tax=Bartonella sp. DGB1 TaxID=3239807 RepID=UPI00352687B4